MSRLVIYAACLDVPLLAADGSKLYGEMQALFRALRAWQRRKEPPLPRPQPTAECSPPASMPPNWPTQGSFRVRNGHALRPPDHLLLLGCKMENIYSPYVMTEFTPASLIVARILKGLRSSGFQSLRSFFLLPALKLVWSWNTPSAGPSAHHR